MGTIFEPFIIAFWVFIIALAAFLIGGIIYAIRDANRKSNTKKTKEDEIESTEKIIKK